MSVTYEITTFTVSPENSEAMLASRPALERVLGSEIDGFRSIRLLRVDESTWIDLVEWDTPEHAKAAMEVVMQRPEAEAMFATIDEVVSMVHAESTG
jgi:hypothetical protein